MIRLIAVDLDDTLLGEDKQISERNFQAIQAAKQQGVEVVLATARGWFGTKSFYQQLELNSLAVCGSGTKVYDNHENCVKSWSIPLETAQEILAIAEQNDIMMICSLPDKNLFNFVRPDWENKIRSGIDIVVPDLAKKITDSPTQLFVKGEREVQILQKTLPSSHSHYAVHTLLYQDGIPEMMIIHPEVNKASGVAWVCQQMGIEQSEVLALGDSANDISMLSWAGVGVAMGWSNETVKAAANFATEHDDLDGVATAIERFVLGR
ncbi:Cof-type HAD-IIB family hydrolase [Brevibacillus sp. SYSU BS000544]|uniref:Cof-type HAD-IIB family hydrolase n=1 Tax=Brevibacillus sp. SYSU BS000544 TaxID=3416443 RepID=UPI003CE52CDF